MRIRILRPALDDLAAGRRFYDRQQAGVGSYFFDSVFAEIDSLVLHARSQGSVADSLTLRFSDTADRFFPLPSTGRGIEGEG